LILRLGKRAYGALLLVIFCEPGIVFFWLLPGETLLIVAGVLAGGSLFGTDFLLLILIHAVVLGESVNYWIGHSIGISLVKETSP
jgi:membrane-associated protein